MAMSKEILEETEFAKNHIMSHSNLDEKCKKSVLRLLNIASTATNGVSLEEKVQLTTEAIFGMVISQIAFLDTIDKKIENANKEQCKICKAMKHANEEEELKKQQQIIEQWKKEHGFKEEKFKKQEIDPSHLSLFGMLKTILVKPYAWLFGIVLVFSPYGVQIVEAILKFFDK